MRCIDIQGRALEVGEIGNGKYINGGRGIRLEFRWESLRFGVQVEGLEGRSLNFLRIGKIGGKGFGQL